MPKNSQKSLRDFIAEVEAQLAEIISQAQGKID
jgi:hypothetical protein